MKPFLLAALAAFLLAAPSASFAQSSGAFSFGAPKAANPADVVTVQAKGQGESVEAAKKDAVRNAIKMAVGELVDAKTLVENDELVEDKILTLSNAMVEKADYGDAKSVGDGLFEVPVTAVVKKGQLNKELKAIGITTGSVAGDSLAAELFSGKERVANAEKFFAERFKDFPQNVMEAVMLTNDDGTPAIGFTPGSRKGIYWRDDLAKEGHLYADVGVRVNMENYAEWTRQLKELLDAICSSHWDDSMAFAKTPVNDDRLVAEMPTTGSEGTPVVIATPKKPERATWPVTVYWLDDSIFKALGETLAKTFPKNANLEIALKDADGEIVCSAKAMTDGGGNAALYNFADRTNYHPCYIGTGDFRANEYPTIPVSGMMQKINGFEGLFIGPVPGVAASFHKDGFATPQAGRLKEVTKPFRLDLGVVSEEDLAEVTGYEVKIEYK